MKNKQPPFEITNKIVDLVAQAAELAGRLSVSDRFSADPVLRHGQPHPGRPDSGGSAGQMPRGRPLGVQEGVTMERGKIILETERLVLTELTERDKNDAIRLYYHVDPVVSRFADLGDGFATAMYGSVAISTH